MKAENHDNHDLATPGKDSSKKQLVIGSVCFFIFLLIAALVFSQVTQKLDSHVALIIYNMNLGSTFTSIAILSSDYGREFFWIPIIAIMLVFGKQSTKYLAIELALLFVVGIVVGEGIKYVTYRARPFDTVSGIVARLPEISDSSFPSGHALIVSIGAVFALIKFKGGKANLIAILLAIEAAIVCFSRVFLGLHYPLDVLGALFLASSIVFVGSFVIEIYFANLIRRVAKLADRAARNFRIPEFV
jgi:undecaprenyl-diphosphatase